MVIISMEQIKTHLSESTINELKKLPFEKALFSCLEIWADRFPKYGVGWKENKEYHMMALISEKFKRLEYNFENPSEKDRYENKAEILRDLINWSLFYLQNVEDNKY